MTLAVNTAQLASGNGLYTDTSGNVGFGTTSPAVKVNAVGSIAASDSTTPAKRLQLDMGASAGTINCANYGTGMLDLNVQGQNVIFNTGLIGVLERARIDSSGNLLLNTTSASVTNRAATFNVNNIASRDTLGLKQDTNTLFNICSLVSTTSGTRYHIGFGDGTTFTERGTISTNGTSTTYSTSSDYRLKENITPMTGALIKVAQMRPVNWTWKENGEAGQGFIAHELQSVIPDAVVGQKDEVDENGLPRYQSVDTSFLVATLTAAIQELKAEVDQLRAQLEAK